MMTGLELHDEFFGGNFMKIFKRGFTIINVQLLFRNYARKMIQDKMILNVVQVHDLKVVLDGRRSAAVTDGGGIFNWLFRQFYVDEVLEDVTGYEFSGNVK
jgi:hypothetical protein